MGDAQPRPEIDALALAGFPDAVMDELLGDRRRNLLAMVALDQRQHHIGGR